MDQLVLDENEWNFIFKHLDQINISEKERMSILQSEAYKKFMQRQKELATLQQKFEKFL